MKNQWLYKISTALMIVILAVAVFPVTSAYAAACTFTSTGSGNWGTNATWTITGAGCPASGAAYPGNTAGNTDAVVIVAGHTVAVNVPPPQVLGAVTVSGTLNNNAGNNDLPNIASLTVNSGGTVIMYRPLTVTGTTSITGTINFASTSGTSRAMVFNGAVTLNSGAVWTEPAGGNGANNTYAFANNFTNNATTFTALGTGIHTFSGAGMTMDGATATSIPNVTITGTRTNNGTLTVTTALTGAGTLTQGAGATLNLGGTSTITTLTPSGANNTVNYTAAGVQTVRAVAYQNLGLSGNGAKAMTNGTSVAGNMNIAGTALANITNGLTITVNSLSFGGVGQLNGTWGSTTSAATNKTNTYFSATTGMLNVTTNTGVVAPTVTTSTASSISTTGATLGANVTNNGGGSILARGTCWGTTPAPAGNCVAEGGTTTGVFTQTRTGFTAGTLYYYRGYATNSAGTSYSADGTFTADSTLTVTGPASITYPNTGTITTNGGGLSGGLLSYATSSGGCTVVPATGVITITNAGITPCVVTATRAAGGLYITQTSANFNVTLVKGTSTASITNSPITYDGLPHTATVVCVGGGTATLASGGTGTDAGSYPTTVDCAASANYAAVNGLVPTNGAFVISPATPTVSITNNPVIYNGSAQTAAVTCLGGGIATLASGGTGTDAGSYPTTVNCAASTNYVAVNGLNPGSFVINPATPTASITNSPAIYTGSVQTATVACLGGGTATLASGGTGTDAGSYPATVNCAASTNYIAATNLSVGDFVIDPATPTASITNSPSTYNGSAQTAIVTCSGGGTATLASGGTGTNAGSYPATVNCAASANYVSANGLNPGNFVIDSATPTASITNSPITYTGSAQTATVACLGGGVASLASGGTGTNAGSYSTTVDCAASANYVSASGLNAGNFVIAPATPTASITNSPKPYNGSAQTATVACLGGGTATLASGGTGTNTGSYSATVDCAASTNYSAAFGLAAGDFVINPITPTASITNSPVTYNGSAQTAVVACLGGGTATLASGGTGTNVGSYPATVDCAASTNYIAATNLSVSDFVIDPATPTASITNSPVTYNGSAQTAIVTCSGGGTATLASGGTGTNAGSYPATVNCAASANYVSANGLNPGNFVIDPATPTASIINSPVTYNGSAQTAVVACLGGGVASLASGGTGTNAGSYPATVNCAASTNYNAAVGLLAGNFVINPAIPTASITNSPVNYNGSVQTATVACLGGGVATLASGGTGTNASSYPATVNCAASTNYSAAVGVNAGSFVINRINPTASITNSPSVYSGAAQTAAVACLGGGVATLASGGTGTNVGSYPATVNCALSTNYNAAVGLLAGNFVISPATPTASITNSPVNYNGTAQTAVVACLGGGTATLASGGTGTNASSYPATVNCAASANYSAAVGLLAGNFVINRIAPTASITNSPVNYNGSAQTATVACLGGGVATLASGGTGTNASSYPATVNCALSMNYNAATGLTAGNFVINRINPTASITNSPVNYNGSAQTAVVSCLGGGIATLASGGTGTDAGSYPASVNCAASTNYNAAVGLTAGSFVINRINPTASVTNTPQNYNGAAKSATVACLGGGAASNILTGGAATQMDAGTYPVTVNCAVSTNYNAVNGLTAGNFVINRITPTASITNSPVSYNGSVQTAAAACLGGGAATLASGGTGTDVGSYPATVDCAVSTNYNPATGLAAGNFVINPIAPTATVTNGPVDYDGLTHAATVSCLGGGAASNIQTGGSANQTNAGTYTVTADCAASTNYAAATGVTASNSFVINRITPTASVSNTPQDYTGAAQSATVSCLGGGAASNISTGGAASQTDAGTYPVTADCAASTNYNAANGVAAGNFVINPIAPTASVTNTPQSYTGLAQSATVACLGGGAASNILTGGAATQTDAGTYPVTADCAASTNYISATNLAAGNFVISNISQIITVTTSAPATASNGSTFNVAATSDSGLIVTITSSGSCTFVDNGDGTAAITMTSGSGTCSVFYDQAGNVNYTAASQVQEDVTATEGPTFTSLNTVTFDAGFAGTFNVTATGTPSTMSIISAGALPSGVTFVDNGNGTAVLSGTPAVGTNGTYNLVFTANNGVAPDDTQSFTLKVKNGPTVGANGINSTPDTGDGSVTENESIIDTLGLTKLTVQFSQDVYDDPTDTLDFGHDVTNPANYILVRSTTNSFATIDCAGGVVAPDVSIKVNSVTYSNGGGSGPYVATLFINDGFPLNVVGFYRLYVCGTTSIVDANNRLLELAGNGTTPGTDFLRNFRIATAVVTTDGGGRGASSTTKSVVTNGFLIPVTGFAPDQVTTLPVQPADKMYTSMGQMTIEIPSLGVKFPIVGATISNKTWDLTWLKNSVAYLEGSAYPTTAGNTVLTAHVQDANKNLGPFSDIKGMQLGQNIYIHVNGQVYVYQVQENSKIASNNIATMFKHEEDSWITLVTCEDYNAKTGVYSNRRMVRAVLISVIFEK